MAQGVEEILVAADAAELDLTNAHLRNLDDVPLPESLSVRQIGMSLSDAPHCSFSTKVANSSDRYAAA